MESVLVLIAEPGSSAIAPAILALAERHGAKLLRWLAPGDACELTVPQPIEPLLMALSHAPIDANVIPQKNRKKRLLVADMDSTMIQQECIDELGEVAGQGAHIRDVTARAMRGELDLAAALKERVALLAGLPESVIPQLLRERITLMPGGRQLLATMRGAGAYTALVSGGFTAFTGPVAARLGFDEDRANVLEVANGKLTGRVLDPILGANAKLEALHHLTTIRGLTIVDSLAVGDGANDLPMLQAAGLGVALHAKPHVQAQVKCRINHGDLSSLLYLQGYTSAEFS